MYVVIVFSLCVLSNRISYPMFSRCSATADFLYGHGASYVFLASDFNGSGSLAHVHFATSHRMQYTLDVLRPRFPLISLTVIGLFFIGMWMV
jgi:hypothetical protein